MLVNTRYLQAGLADPFGKYPTDETADFTRLDGSMATVGLMNDNELFLYAIRHLPTGTTPSSSARCLKSRLRIAPVSRSSGASHPGAGQTSGPMDPL